MGGAVVGRDRELRDFRAALASAEVVAVVGPAGIGKTTLVTEGLAQLPHRRGEALWAMGAEPYSVLQQALRIHLDGHPEGVAEVVLQLLGSGVLVVDNLHWADPATLEVLQLVRGRIRVVVTSREEVDGQPRALLDSAHVIRLGPLAPGAAERQARRLHPLLDAGTVAELLRVAAGNPLLLEQLVGGAGALTPTLRDAVESRLSRLAPSARHGLSLLAVLGRPAPPELVAADGAELESTGLAHEVDGQLEFGHELLADAMLELLGDDERGELHGELAERLPDPEAARHELAAGRPERAKSRALAAARQSTDALRRGRYLELAADAAAGTDAPDASLWIRAAESLVEGGAWVEAVEMADRARVADPSFAAEAELQRGRAQWFAGEVDAARRALASARQLTTADQPELLARILVERAYLEVRDQLRGTVGLAEEALAAAEAAGCEVLRARATLGAALFYDGRSGESLLRSVIEEAGVAGEGEVAAMAAYHLVSFLGFFGRLPEGSDLAADQQAATDALGLGTLTAHFRAVSITNRAIMSRDTELVIADARDLLERHPLFRNRSQVRAAEILMLVDLGRVAEAQNSCEAMADEVRTDDDRAWLAAAEGELAWLTRDVDLALQAIHRGRQAGDAYFGLRLFSEAAGAHVLFEAGETHDADLPSFAVPTFWAALHEVEALRRAGGDDPVGAVSELDRATEAWMEVSMPRFALRSTMAAARIATRHGIAGATRRWTAGVDLARRHHLIGALLRYDVTVLPELTIQEERILRLVGQGLTTPKIATELSITPLTVDQHVEAARRKLGTRTRREAAARVVAA